MEHAQILFTLAILFGFFMAFGVGANDVANAMGTSVGSRALSFKQAIFIAAIFEAAGALLAGGKVTQTIGHGILSAPEFTQHPQLLVYGMLAALLAAGTWLIVASRFGWPVSTTHSIIGAVVGFAATIVGVHAIVWSLIANIVLSWLLTPMISGVLAFLLFLSVQKFIFNSDNPFKSTKRWVPRYIFLVSLVITTVTASSGLPHLGILLTPVWTGIFAFTLSLIIMFIGQLAMRHVTIDPNASLRMHFRKVEQMFGVLMVFTACSMAFAHGSNDVANAIGPLAAIVNMIQHNTPPSLGSTLIPSWVMLLGAAGIVTGLSLLGYRVITTVGRNITNLTPTRGFAAELATASTVIIASGLGLPISTTQTLVGSILGVGFARGIAAIDLGVIRNILMSWVITLPAGAVFTIIYFYILKGIFG